jgi:hypothetical protein
MDTLDFIKNQIVALNAEIRKANEDYCSATDPDERARLYELLQMLQKQRMTLFSTLEKSYEPGVLPRPPLLLY